MSKLFYYFFAIFLVGGLFFIKPVFAEQYKSYSGFIGTIDQDTSSTNCTGGSYGIKNDDTTSECRLYVKIDLPDGATIKNVVVYYYDNSGSQRVSGYFGRSSLSSTSYGVSPYFSDSSTSSSVQSYTLTPSTTSISSGYTYYLMIRLYYGAEYRGIKVVY